MVGMLASIPLLIFNRAFNWVAISVLVTWVLVGGLLLTFWQIFMTRESIEEQRKSTNAQIAMDLFRELRSDRALEIIRTIYNRKENDPNKLDTIDKHNIEYILDRFEVLGILVDEGIVDKRLAMDSYGGASALRCWYRLHPYIKEIEKKRGQYKINYKSYAQRCLKYFKERNFSVILITESENIDIISELLKPEFGLNTEGNKTT
jgi:hypothetical protein